MPRVENLGKNVANWSAGHHEPSSVWDICVLCWHRLRRDPHLYDDTLVPYGDGEPHGMDGRGGEVAHPSYYALEDRCASCGLPLFEDIDG